MLFFLYLFFFSSFLAPLFFRIALEAAGARNEEEYVAPTQKIVRPCSGSAPYVSHFFSHYAHSVRRFPLIFYFILLWFIPLLNCRAPITTSRCFLSFYFSCSYCFAFNNRKPHYTTCPEVPCCYEVSDPSCHVFFFTLPMHSIAEHRPHTLLILLRIDAFFRNNLFSFEDWCNWKFFFLFVKQSILNFWKILFWTQWSSLFRRNFIF